MKRFLIVGGAVLAALTLGTPAAGTAHTNGAWRPAPGRIGAIDVSVATLWRAPGLGRAIDAPALTNPVDLDRWNRHLATTASRAWLDSRVVTQALYGEKVTVLSVSGRWTKVAVHGQPTPLDRRGYPGWLPTRQLAAPYNDAGPNKVVLSRTAVLHLHGRALRLSYGTRLPVTGADAAGRWLVRTPDGPGWLAHDDLRKTPRPTGESIVAAAKRFRGLRYLWGGTSAWGFDCSGLVWNVFHAHGVTVPRDTGPQSRNGRRVSVGNLRPGDLVFYGSPATHVAIVAAHGTMIESPDSAHSVRVVPLRPGFASARRYTTG